MRSFIFGEIVRYRLYKSWKIICILIEYYSEVCLQFTLVFFTVCVNIQFKLIHATHAPLVGTLQSTEKNIQSMFNTLNAQCFVTSKNNHTARERF